MNVKVCYFKKIDLKDQIMLSKNVLVKNIIFMVAATR